MADNSARITAIQEILESGTKSVAYDGTSVEYDLASLRAELRRLQLDDDTQSSLRPAASSICLGNF